MPTATLLKALQFGDSMFPVGSFSFSNGLESAIEENVVHDRDSLRDFVWTAARTAAGCDGVAVLHAHRAASTGDPVAVRHADQAVYARKLNEEVRTMTVRMGRKLGEAGGHITAGPQLAEWSQQITAGSTPGTYPVGLGVLFADLQLAEAEAFAVHQYGLAAMMLGAALRLMRVHHLDTQAILFEVNANAEGEYHRVAQLALSDMAAFSPATDILAAIHVNAHVRMFMN